ncbi:conserved exported hypothetical protein [Desulfamplus magnetovallimortis]|uniref:Lipoprotein n=1 Tax=Desulfamplus magnetovallimortis TaxID=1246637 RepID=A0A1W1H8P5_9BACT|nr:hypothetical protein [Desulfamplus magnetovallimortis]SLM28857.1 conserved exported hypothetical protein [Desulfamplus magnetovallimortis]
MKINMKSKPVIKASLFLVASAMLLLNACSNDESTGDYSGVGKLISDRNKARIRKAASDSQEQNSTDQSSSFNDGSEDASSERITPGLTFEENVKIVSESSGKTIARAIAYLDKSGRIINIRIMKN